MSTTDTGGEWSGPRPTDSKDTGSVKAVAGALKQEAASFAGQAKEKAAEQIEQHKETATRTLGDFANAVRKAGEELSQDDQSMAGRLVRQAADGLEGFARSVSDKRPEEMLDAVRDFGRRNPTALIAGSVLAGLALGRFLKSSSGQQAQTSDLDLGARFYGSEPVDSSQPAYGEPTNDLAVRGEPDEFDAGAEALETRTEFDSGRGV